MKPNKILSDRRRVAEQMPEITEVLRGSLRRRYVRCGKAGCHCAEGRGHGPVVYLSVTLGVGRTRQITIAAEDYEVAARYVRNYQRLWALLEKISSMNTELLQKRTLNSQPQSAKRRSERRGQS